MTSTSEARMTLRPRSERGHRWRRLTEAKRRMTEAKRRMTGAKRRATCAGDVGG